MEPVDFITQLRHLLSEADCQVVISALRQDPNVWESLRQPAIALKMLETAGMDIRLWNPAALFLIQLNNPEATGDLLQETLHVGSSLYSLSPDLRKKSVLEYEKAYRSCLPPANLEQAGLIALALRERRRMKGSWLGLGDEIRIEEDEEGKQLFNIWQSPMACLFAMIPDPKDLLSAILPPVTGDLPRNVLALVLHVILSNPLPLEDQVALLTSLISQSNPPAQLRWLQLLDSMGRSPLASALAQVLIQQPDNAFYFAELKLENTKSAPLTGSGQDDNTPGELNDPLFENEPLVLIDLTRQLAAFYEYAGDHERSVLQLQEAADMAHRLEARISFQMALSSGGIGDENAAIQAWDQAYNLLPSSATAQAGLASALVHANQIEKAAAIVSKNSNEPLLQLIQARLTPTPEGQHATPDKAAFLYQALLRQTTLISHQNAVIRQTAIQPTILASIDELITLKSTELALNLTEQNLKNQPVDLALIKMACQVYHQAGRLPEAIQMANISLMLQPGQLDQHRLLAQLLEEAQAWDQALIERQQVINSSSPPAVSDSLALAQCGLSLGRQDITLSVCQAILAENPGEGYAQYLCGEAHLRSNDISSALNCFIDATLVIPEQVQPWLALSAAQAKSGDAQKSLETLRSASLSIPQSPEIMAALGEASLKNNSPSEALPSLRTAFALNPQSIRVACLLSDTLLHLGHYGEARLVVENLIQSNPNHPDLAFNYARCLLASGAIQQALPSLMIAAQAASGQIQPAILLGQTVMNVREETNTAGTVHRVEPARDSIIDLESVSHCLRQALSLEPEDPEIRLLLGEILTLNDQTQEANQIFRSLAESDKSKDPTYYWRIQYGLGQTALKLGQVDTALAALQEAASAKPDRNEIQQVLSEAFLQASLFQEALQTARLVLIAAPDSLSCHIWFSRLMLDLNYLPDAINALKKAVDMAPERSDLVLLLGQTYSTVGDLITAQQTLDQLISLENATSSELKQAASLFDGMGEIDKTITYLEKACEKQGEPQFELLVELAKAYDRAENSKCALESVEQAALLKPNDASLMLFQASLYEKNDQRQSALGCLQNILESIDSDSRPQGNNPSDPVTIAEIHFRIAQLLRSLGDVQTAFTHAEESVQLAPQHIRYLTLAAHLAYSLMDSEKVSHWSHIYDQEDDETFASLTKDPANHLSLVRLLCTNAEVAFEKDDPRQAYSIILRASQLSPDHPRGLALLARIMKKNGEISIAEQHFTQAFSSLNQTHILDRAGNIEQPSWLFDPDCIWDILAVAEAALDLQQWQVSLSLFQRAFEKSPYEARPRLLYAKALVICAEAQLTFQALHVKTHAPGEEKIDAAHADMFEDAYLSANRLCQSTEIIHWHNRGQAVFHPGPQTAKSLANYILGSDDTAALIAAYSRVNQLEEAQKAAQDCFNQPEVLLQLNLALKDSNMESSLAAIQSAIEIEPHNPLLQAAYAYTIPNDGHLARQGIETALSFWPDEPEWQHFAAELCQESEDSSAAITHWQQAVHLEPGSYPYNFALGNEYFYAGDFTNAITSLDQAIHINPFQSEAWFGLAKSNYMLGNYTEAMSCAEQTCDLAPNQVDPLLLTGEIALSLGQHQKAISKAQAVMNLNPQDASAILLHSRALNAMGQSQAALEMIDLNLTGVAKPIYLLIERARLIKQIQGIQYVLPVLQDLAQKNPGEPEVLRLLAETQAETGQMDAAERTAQNSLKLLPNQPSLHLLLGKIQRVKGQLDQAISHLCESIRLDTNQIETYLELGRAYQDRRDHLQALKIYRQATQIAPNDPRPYFNAGLALRESKDYLAAETMFRHAARLSPDDINIRRQLGAIITLNLVHHPQEASIIS